LSVNDVEERIIHELRESPAEMHTEAIADRIGLVRHTASKYLQILKAKGLVQVRKVGNAKLWRDPLRGLIVRDLVLQDIPSILRLESLSRTTPPELGEKVSYLGETARGVMQQSDSRLGLGAEIEGELVGYVLGKARTWEFGSVEPIGWIEAISVDPSLRRREIGRRLGEELLNRFSQMHITRVRTLVDWYDGELLAFFKSMGFDLLAMIPLEHHIKPTM